MRPEEYVVGQERTEHQRGLLEQHQEEFEEGEARSYDEQVAEVRIADREHHDDVMAALHAILEGRPMELEEKQLSEQEKSALEALRSAAIGKDARYNKFIYAEQRRELLEQALAALQPILALDVSLSPELRENYDTLVGDITELRERLVNLEDAQDDEMILKETEEKGEGQDDTDDTDDTDDDKRDGDKGDEVGDGEPRPSTLFDGPELPERKLPPSALSDGPAAPAPGGQKSTLFDGPAVERPASKSTVLDEDAGGEDAGDESAGGKAEGKGGVLSRIGRALRRGKPDAGGKG
jgi:hypothetical protein